MVDMPRRTIDFHFRFLRQNGGRLSNRAREREFAALTDKEAKQITAIYQDTFDATAQKMSIHDRRRDMGRLLQRHWIRAI